MTDTRSESNATRQRALRLPVWVWLTLWMMMVVGASVPPITTCVV